MFRIGQGYDVHRFTAEKKNIIIGGIEIPYYMGLKAHSDGDVLIHAICDSIIGALGLGDIGTIFPDTDLKFKNIDSKFFLSEIKQITKNRNYYFVNIDCTIVAQEPKMVNYTHRMKLCMANILDINISNINIKSTTTEKLGYIGKKEGIAAYAVCLIAKK